jgi:hypothetical protein
MMVIALFHAVLTAKADAIGERFVAANHRPGIAGRAEVLRRIKA